MTSSLTLNADGLVEIPGIPAFDPTDHVENAVIRRLAKNWHRRATVKRDEPKLEDLFDDARPDYPEHIVPFVGHPTWERLPDEVRARLLSWAWLAYNRHTVLAEQRVANPAFALIIEGEFPSLGGPALETALAQAMVDEQYHTLMHLNASLLTRERRRIALPDSILPQPHITLVHEQLRDGVPERWQKKLTTLAFCTVSELSISAYLHLLSDDKDIQVINSTTVRLHNRDEVCHSSISGELAKIVYDYLTPAQRQYFVRTMITALQAFVANDFTTWQRILEIEGVPNADRMVNEVREDGSRLNLVRDFGGLHALLTEMDLVDEVRFDWAA